MTSNDPPQSTGVPLNNVGAGFNDARSAQLVEGRLRLLEDCVGIVW